MFKFWKRNARHAGNGFANGRTNVKANGGRCSTDDVEMLQRFFMGCTAFDISDDPGTASRPALPFLMSNNEIENRDSS